MRTLFIDTHLWNTTLLLFEGKKVIREILLDKEKSHSTSLFPAIVAILNNEDFDNIIVVNGPGSFTGVRLGVTIAKTFAYLKKTPIRTVNYLECMAISSKRKNVGFSDGNGYYVGFFDDNLEEESPLRYVSKDDFANMKSVETEVTIDYEKVYNYAMTKERLDPHDVNPIYIKKLV
jgi:universal bacterial protein YeaZ